MDEESLSRRLTGLRAKADEVVGSRRKRLDLYLLLADCMRTAQETDETELREVFLADEKRRYVETGTDRFGIVSRVVFERRGGGRRDVVWRYAAVMRVAAESQVRWEELADWLEREGGVVEVWNRWRERRGVKVVRTVTLVLEDGVVLEEGRWVEGVRVKIEGRVARVGGIVQRR